MAAPSTPVRTAAPRQEIGDETSAILSPLKSPRQKTPKTGQKKKEEQTDFAKISWHALDITEVFRLLETNPATGITDSDAKHRETSLFGRNVMTPPQKVNFLLRYVEHATHLHVRACR
jgi:hypothetical protein